jgi:hypothetical protein
MRTSQEAALWDEQRVGVDQMAEVFAVAAIRFGSTEAEQGLRRLSRYFTWGAFGVPSHVVMGEDSIDEDLAAIRPSAPR